MTTSARGSPSWRQHAMHVAGLDSRTAATQRPDTPGAAAASAHGAPCGGARPCGTPCGGGAAAAAYAHSISHASSDAVRTRLPGSVHAHVIGDAWNLLSSCDGTRCPSKAPAPGLGRCASAAASTPLAPSSTTWSPPGDMHAERAPCTLATARTVARAASPGTHASSHASAASPPPSPTPPDSTTVTPPMCRCIATTAPSAPPHMPCRAATSATAPATSAPAHPARGSAGGAAPGTASTLPPLVPNSSAPLGAHASAVSDSPSRSTLATSTSADRTAAWPGTESRTSTRTATEPATATTAALGGNTATPTDHSRSPSGTRATCTASAAPPPPPPPPPPAAPPGAPTSHTSRLKCGRPPTAIIRVPSADSATWWYSVTVGSCMHACSHNPYHCSKRGRRATKRQDDPKGHFYGTGIRARHGKAQAAEPDTVRHRQQSQTRYGTGGNARHGTA
eukprot:353126-Chlamydomonas_euryale.AAC.6